MGLFESGPCMGHLSEVETAGGRATLGQGAEGNLQRGETELVNYSNGRQKGPRLPLSRRSGGYYHGQGSRHGSG